MVRSTGTPSGSAASAAAALVAGVASGLSQRTPPDTIAESSVDSRSASAGGPQSRIVFTRALCSSARTTRTTIGFPAMGVRHLAATPAATATGSSRPRSAASTMALNNISARPAARRALTAPAGGSEHQAEGRRTAEGWSREAGCGFAAHRERGGGAI